MWRIRVSAAELSVSSSVTQRRCLSELELSTLSSRSMCLSMWSGRWRFLRKAYVWPEPPDVCICVSRRGTARGRRTSMVGLTGPGRTYSSANTTLVEAANLIEAQKRLNPNLIASGQLDLRGRTTLPELNRVTVRQFEQMLRLTRTQVLSFRLVPPGSRFLLSKGWAGKAVLAVLKALTRLPVLRELLTTKIVCVLARESAS